jgi:predicted component of type VI protein secretion system
MADKSGNELESTVIAKIPELPINQELLEESTSIKEQWKVVRDRLEKIEASKSQVNPTVYERVKKDYQARLEDVTKELMDKKQSIDAELEGLYTTRAKIAEQLEAQRHELEELKFRNTLGEFSEDEYQTKTKERQDTIAKFETAINSVTANISRYESIFHEEAELLGVEAATPDMEGSAVSPADEEEPLPGDTGRVDISDASEAALEEPFEETAEETAEEKPYEEEPLKTDEEGYILNEMEGDYFAEGEEAAPGEDSQTLRADVKKKPPKKTDHPRARVVIISGDQAGAAYPLKDTVSLGRADSCTIVLKDAKTSRQHAQIQQHGDEFIIVDLSSSNGTFVNGQRIDEHVLQNNDEVQIGDYILQFQE